MTLSAGNPGPYEVLSPLGAGGMAGEGIKIISSFDRLRKNQRF